MDFIRELLPLCSCLICWKKPSRYGYSVIRAPGANNSRVSLLSNISLDKPLPSESLEFIEDHQDEIVQCLSYLKTSQILLEIPALGRKITNQLSDITFIEDDEEEKVQEGNIIRSENEANLKENLVYLAAFTSNVDRLLNELYVRKLLMYTDVITITQQQQQQQQQGQQHPILKALEMYKRVLKQPDSLGFIIGALKVTGSDHVAEILVSSFPLSSNTELICRISLTPEFSPEFRLEGQPGKYRKLRKIPRDRQQILTSITGSYLDIKAKTLLKSLDACHELRSIKLTNVRIRKEFQYKVCLPNLKEFTFHIRENFQNKKEFFDHIKPQRILSLLFFKTDENNNDQAGTTTSFLDSNTVDDWDINQIWRMNVDISLKIAGRTVLLIDHVKSRLFSRLENNYKIPENVIQPVGVKCLYLGWCRISRSSIPLYLTRLHLYSVQLIDRSKDRTYLCSILNHLLNLREFKYWGNIGRQPWPILKTSLFPPKLKILAASFIEIVPDMFLSHLESVCLYIYHVRPENDLTFLTHFLLSTRRVSLINFPPFQRPTEEQLLSLMRGGRARQILFGGIRHQLNFEKHYLYFKNEVLREIGNSQMFMLSQENRLWKGERLSVDQIVRHLHLKFGFEAVYTLEAFRQHEILESLWNYFCQVI